MALTWLGWLLASRKEPPGHGPVAVVDLLRVMSSTHRGDGPSVGHDGMVTDRREGGREETSGAVIAEVVGGAIGVRQGLARGPVGGGATER